VSDRDRFDKFTEKARKVLSLAQEEAQRFQHNYIGPEHILLGLVRMGEGVAVRVLIGLGIDISTVRERIESIIDRRDSIDYSGIGLTPHAKRVMELAVDEARRLNHHYIGTEHLLLGLVRGDDIIAAGVLESLGVNIEKAREQTILVLGQFKLSHIQRLYIQTIFNYFHEHGSWPTYGLLEREISQIHRDFDMREVSRSLPNGFANAFALNFDRKQEAILRIQAIRLCKGTDAELADFVHVLKYCVNKYFSFEENNLQVTSEEIRTQLNMTELSIRKVGRLIEAEGWFWSSLGRNDVEGSWVCALTPGMDGIARFDKVETIEQYLEKVDQFTKTFAAPAPRIPQSVEDTDILSTRKLERLLDDIGYKYDETSSLEIKENIPSAKELARIMAAFANTEGGVIIIGMTDNFRIVGVPESLFEKG